MSDPSTADHERMAELDALISAIGSADADTLLGLRELLLSAMFPSMPGSARDVVVPLFALMTLEARSIEQGRPRLGAARQHVDGDRQVRGPIRVSTKAG